MPDISNITDSVAQSTKSLKSIVRTSTLIRARKASAQSTSELVQDVEITTPSRRRIVLYNVHAQNYSTDTATDHPTLLISGELGEDVVSIGAV